MTHAQPEQEIKRLMAMTVFDPDNPDLACRIARLALSLRDWSRAEAVLAPLVRQWGLALPAGAHTGPAAVPTNPGDASPGMTTRDAEAKSAALLAYGQALWAQTRPNAREYLEWSVQLDPTSTDALVALAECFLETGDHGPALTCFERAYGFAPDEPRVLAGFVSSRLALTKGLDSLAPIEPSLESAVRRCRESAEVKLGLPGIYHDMGLFLLLLARPYEALAAYAKGAAISRSDELAGPLRVIERLHAARGELLTGCDWVRGLLIAALAMRLTSELRQITIPASDGVDPERRRLQARRAQLLASARLPSAPCFDAQIRIVAGGTHAGNEQRMRQYRPLLEAAFAGYCGTVISGGTTAGIAGLVGDLPDVPAASMRRIACVPVNIPGAARIHPAYAVYASAGHGFSPLEPIQTWIDLLAAGIDPAQVRLLGIGGGRISAIEYRMALMLGATVGVVRDSGGAVSDLLHDAEWNHAPGLLELPPDPCTLRLFVQGIPRAEILSEHDREFLARATHDAYRGNQIARLAIRDPAVAEWENLPDDLRQSNLNQIDHIETSLGLVGLRLSKSSTEDADQFALSPEQVETMAASEHARWTLECLDRGWRLGEPDFNARKTPYLVSWAELPEAARDWDRQAVVALPAMLRLIGYRIVANEARATGPGDGSAQVVDVKDY